MSNTARAKSVGDKLAALEVNQDLPVELTSGTPITATPIAVYIKDVDGYCYETNANYGDERIHNFVGFAVDLAGGSGSPISVQTHGLVTGFSGLDAGKKYYLSGIPGGIITSATPLGLLVGVAVSTTELLMSGIIVIQKESDFGGDGSDGEKTVASSENLDFGGAATLVKNYASLVIDAGQTLGATNVAANGGVMILKVSGNCTINGIISMAEQGGAGGAAGGASAAGGNGSHGYKALMIDKTAHYGIGGVSDGGYGTGGGGGAHQSAGVNGSSTTGTAEPGGNGGAAIIGYGDHIDQNLKAVFFACGSGGGGGGGNTADVGGAGGRGGGVIILEVAGDLTFGASSTLTVVGAVGSNGTGTNAGAGGGGAGGQIYVLYNGTLTDGGVTKTVSGGAGGSGTGGGEAGDGGAGGAGDTYVEHNTSF